MKLIKSHKTFDGFTQFWEHQSYATKTKMNFSAFVPGGEVKGCLIWLSGLTCTEENFIMKAGAQKYLAEHKLMVVCPDTSPRGLTLPKEHETSDFGSGAGFYVDSITPGFADHYRMYSYVTQELYQIILTHFRIKKDSISVFGHSMGGHGALIMGLRDPQLFKSVSVFAPVVNPSQSPWGRNAFLGYLGDDERLWHSYDACELVKAGKSFPGKILIDQGDKDPFLSDRLLLENFTKACQGSRQVVEIRYQPEYDHSYYFIATFIESHIRFHAKALFQS